MQGRLKKLVLAVVVLYIIWKFLSGLVGGLGSGSAELLTDRLWMERLPQQPRELAHVLTLRKVRDHRVGFAAAGSTFRWQVDLVEWSLERDVLTLVTKQDDVVTRFDVKVRRCAGEAPKPFDLCLDLRAGGQTFHYFSREDWKKLGEPVLSEDEATALVERAAHLLETTETSAPPREGLPSWLPRE